MADPPPAGALDPVASIKVKLGLLVATSVVVAALLVTLGGLGGVPALLTIPVSVALALGVTQLLAAGMTAPLRRMTEATQQMARGDYSVRVRTSANDEVGRLASAFNQMAADLATVDRERRDLLATVSHELRTPLTAMTAQLENLADGVVPADEQHLAEALGQAERLRDLVADLLDLSRLEHGVARLDPRPLTLRTLVEDSARQVAAAGRLARYDVRVPAGLLVTADEARLRQLLVNVLDNAGRHSPADAPVVVTAGQDDATVQVVVADRGPGVEPERRERVFTRFGTDDTGGTGLGLAVARWVAELHGGTLRFTDPADGAPGAHLVLTLPSTPRTPVAASPQEEPVSVPTVSSGPAPAAPSQPAGILAAYWPEGPDLPGTRVVVAAAVAGLLAALLFTFHGLGIGSTLILLGSGVAVAVTARERRSPWSIACTALAALLVVPLTLRDNQGIAVLGVFTAAAVFLSSTTAARSVSGMVASGLAWPLSSLRGLPWFGRSLRVSGPGRRAPAVVRTVLWSLLGLAVFGVIFASADALFASWVDAFVPNLTFGSLVARAFVGCAVFAMTLGAAYLALAPPRVDAWAERGAPPLDNRFEWLVPVLLVDAVFVLFLVAQAAAVFGGHDYVESTTGLSYADYVHQGFGQLTLATALTLLVVWAASRRAGSTPADRRWLRGSLGLLCLLALVVVASALYRMHVYQEAYGFTTLRLVVDVFEGWLGLVLVTVLVAGLAGRGRWVPRAALVSGAVAVLGLVAVNPDAWVAQRNLDRYEAAGTLDLRYLQSLSADAAPVIADRLPADVAGCVLQRLPDRQLSAEARGETLAWNLGRSRAERALASVDLPDPWRTGPDPCADVWAQYQQDPAGPSR